MPHLYRIVTIGAVALTVFGCTTTRPAVPAIYLDPRPLQWTRPGDTAIFVLEDQIRAEASKQNVNFDRIEFVSVAVGRLVARVRRAVLNRELDVLHL